MSSEAQAVFKLPGNTVPACLFWGRGQQNHGSWDDLKQGLELLISCTVVSVMGAVVPLASKVLGIGGLSFVMLMVLASFKPLMILKNHCLLHENGMKTVLHLFTGNRNSHVG